MFQQRHFEALAHLMQGVRTFAEEESPNAHEVVNYVQRELFARKNGRFDRGRFERACVPGANVRKRVA
jgi:hypothetical protein